MTNETPTTNAERQAAFRAKKEAVAAFNASEVLRLTKENEVLKGEVTHLKDAAKRAKIQYTANVAKLRGQLLKALGKETV
jgi:hypothetical protein